MTYTYDLDGVRIGKTVTEKVGTGSAAYTKTTEYSYTYEGTTLLYEKRIETRSGAGISYFDTNRTEYELYYTYSGLGTLAGIEYKVTANGQNDCNGSESFIVTTNSRGDVECIRYADGTVLLHRKVL